MQFFAMSYLYWLIYEQSHLYNKKIGLFCLYISSKSLQKTPLWIIMSTLLAVLKLSKLLNLEVMMEWRNLPLLAVEDCSQICKMWKIISFYHNFSSNWLRKLFDLLKGGTWIILFRLHVLVGLIMILVGRV